MIPSISSQGGQQGVHCQGGSSQRAQSTAAHIRTSISRSGELDVTTADGDQVSISFSALQQLQAGQSQVQTQKGSTTTQEASQSSDVKAAVKVDGSLSDREVADITRLLQALVGAVNGQKTNQDSTYSTLSNFQFQYKTNLQFSAAYSYLA